MNTLREKLYIYFYGQNSVNWPAIHTERVAQIVEEHYSDPDTCPDTCHCQER